MSSQKEIQLTDGLIIGPEHHRFKLVGSATPHPLGQYWHAEDLSTSKPVPVSLFVLAPPLVRDKLFLAAFKQQIIFAKNLKHTHIAQVFGYFIHKSTLLFFTTEHLDGPTLDTLIREKRTKKFTDSQQKGLLTQLAAAVDVFVNKANQAHGGLGPDLIYINRRGGVKLLPINPRTLFEKSTSPPNPSFLSAAYRPPEAYYENPLPLNADTYSVAAIIYAMLTAIPPFKAEDTEEERINTTLKPLSQLGDKWPLLTANLSALPEERSFNTTALVTQLFDTTPEERLAYTAASESSSEKPADDQSSPSEPVQETVPIQPSEASLPKRYGVIGLSAAFFLGIVIGLSCSWLFLNQQQALMTKSLKTWQKQAETWQAYAKKQEQALASLQQSIKQPTPRVTKAKPDGLVTFRDELTQGGFGPQMVVLPTGSFIQGDQQGQGDDNEQDTRKVTIHKPFALAKHEVTFAEYDQFTQATGRTQPSDEGWGRAQQPVINISWNDAQAYVQWLAEQTHQPYRLPTEAEWEYAARAGTSTAYWWGNELSSKYAVCDGCGTEWDGKQPAPVGSLKASPWGLYDMHGNVDEWVQDCYSHSYKGHPTNGSAYLSGDCQSRVMRGGSWFDIGRVIRSASRYRHPVNAKRNSWGFRVALDVKP